MSAGDELNPWPAFADMLFMLFVTTMVASAVITSWAVASEEKLRGCGSSKDFMEDFARCLNESQPRQSGESVEKTEKLYEETDNACKVSLGESRLKFATSSVALAPEYQAYGREVARCLADNLAVLATANERAVLESIEFIAIDGHTDCQGKDMTNISLGAGRAATIYEMYLEEVESLELDPATRALVLSKVTVRSFGKTRPLPDSPCAQDPVGGRFAESAADRRVEIAVNSRLQRD